MSSSTARWRSVGVALLITELPADALDARSRLIMLYAMCGFANFGSLGIMIAGLNVMAPEHRADIISLGGTSIVSGTLTTCLWAYR